jgi:glutamate/tyrosine decarboxylase-like PLP-dependent enzyme
LGLAGTAPSRVSVDAFAAYAERNPNNIGWHAPGDAGGPFAVTQQLEQDVVAMLASLFGGTLPEVGGVLTAGGTESNLDALWLGRNVLRAAGAGSIAVLASRSAHHSVPAGCDIVGLGAGDWTTCEKRTCAMARALRDEGDADAGATADATAGVGAAARAAASAHVAHHHRAAADGRGLVLVDLDPRYRIDLADLERRIDAAVEAGVTGLLVIATVGSTSTGAVDDVEQIGNTISAARTRHRSLRTFLHVDAAMAGMVLPFLDPPRRPTGFDLRDINGRPVVDSLSVDLHKAGLAPYPCGVFLCRMALRTAIEVPRPFDPGRFDATVAGSRPGAAAAAAWAVLQRRGRSGGSGRRGFAGEAARALRLAGYAAKRFTAIGATVVSVPETNIVAVFFPPERFDPRRVKAVATGHLLTPVFVSRTDADCPTRAYRLVLMPHVRRRDIAAAADAFARVRRKPSREP